MVKFSSSVMWRQLIFSTSVMWINLSFLHMMDVEQFRISPHDRCGEIWIFSTWQIFSPQVRPVVPVTNIMYEHLIVSNGLLQGGHHLVEVALQPRRHVLHHSLHLGCHIITTSRYNHHSHRQHSYLFTLHSQNFSLIFLQLTFIFLTLYVNIFSV